jgi:uncharacterized protein (TIGR01777 family)
MRKGHSLADRIEYALPGGWLAARLAGGAVRAKLNRVFKWRHAALAHAAANSFRYQVKPMKILVSGSTGLIGSALVPALEGAGHSVTRLVRAKKEPADPAIEWHPEGDAIDERPLEGFDVVIHLAGENIAGRWTPEKKEAIRESRVHGTRLLCEALARLGAPPHTLLCASASGIYGNRGDEELIDESPHGKGFLADVCRQWEAATDPAAMVGIRVVNLRFTMVLSPRGGALGAMLPPFRLGLGGPLNGGNQFTSWIAIDDVVGAALHALGNEELKGGVNVTAPHPVRNRDFTDALAHVLHRPALLPAPAIALRFLFGEMADEVLLTSQRVIPERLLMTGYRFQYPELDGALRHLLGK